MDVSSEGKRLLQWGYHKRNCRPPLPSAVGEVHLSGEGSLGAGASFRFSENKAEGDPACAVAELGDCFPSSWRSTYYLHYGGSPCQEKANWFRAQELPIILTASPSFPITDELVGIESRVVADKSPHCIWLGLFIVKVQSTHPMSHLSSHAQTPHPESQHKGATCIHWVPTRRLALC